MNLVGLRNLFFVLSMIYLFMHCTVGRNVSHVNASRLTGIVDVSHNKNMNARAEGDLSGLAIFTRSTGQAVKQPSRFQVDYKIVSTDDNGVSKLFIPEWIFMEPGTRHEERGIKQASTIQPEVTRIADPSDLVLNINSTKELKNIIIPDVATKQKIHWHSANPGIVAVTVNGTVRGISSGVTTVLAMAENGNFSASIKISVVMPSAAVTGISINRNKLRTVAVNKTVAVIAHIMPGNAKNTTVRWRSGDDTIAQVDANGIVTGMSPGQTTIVATTEDGGFTDIASVKVGTVSRVNSLRSFMFLHGGHSYYIVNDQWSTWHEAVANAVENGGYLVHINDAAEQRAIVNALWHSDTFRKSKSAVIENTGSYQQLSSYQSPTVPDGGNVRYMWIGGTDASREGRWVWDGDGNSGTESISMSFTYWGTAGHGTYEPDDYLSQDFAAIALDNWPKGRIYQWNDISHNNLLPYIIEIDK